MKRPEENRDWENLGEQELLVLIGRDLGRGERRLRPLTAIELAARGREWIQANLEHFRAVLCTNAHIRQLALKNDSTELVIAIADLIASISIRVGPFAVAHLLYRRGLHALCRTQWTKLGLTLDS